MTPHPCRVCGKKYDAAAWQALPLKALQRFPDDPDQETLVLRDCPCGNTLAKPLSEEEELKK